MTPFADHYILVCMRAAAIFGLLLAVTYSVLAIQQMASVQTSLEGLTTGGLQLLVGLLVTIQLIVALVVVVAFVTAAAFMVRR